MLHSVTSHGTSWYPPVINIGDDKTLPLQASKPWHSPRVASETLVDTTDLGNRSKLRKVDRACDYCRKRKSKCDGRQRKDNICSACEAEARTCTYLEDSKPRGPPKGYITALELRMAKAEALIRRLSPQLDLTAELGSLPSTDGWKSENTSRQSTPRPSSTRPRSVGDSCSSPTSKVPIRAVSPEKLARRKRARASSEPTTPLDAADYSYHEIYRGLSLSESGMADDGMIMLPASGEQSILRGPVQRRKDVAATSDPTRRASPLHFAANAEAEASMVAGGTHVQYSPPLLPVGVAAPGLDLPHASSSNALHVPTPLRHGAFDSMMLPQISATFDGTSGHVSPDPHPYHIAFGAGAIWDLHTSHTEIHSQPAFSFTAPGENSAFRNYVSPPHTTRVSSCPIPGIDPGISHIRRYTAEPTGGLPLLDQRIPASRTASWPNPEEYCPSSSTYCAW